MLNIYYSSSKRVSNWFVLFIILHGLFTFTPAIRYIHQVILVDFAVVFLCYVSMLQQGAIFRGNKYSFMTHCLIGFIFLYCAMYKFIGVSTASVGTCISYLSLFMSAMFGYILVRFASHKQKIIVLGTWTLFIAVNVIYNIALYQTVLSNIDTEHIGEVTREIKLFNYGGTSFTGYVFFASIVYLILFYYINKKWYRLLSLIMFFICIYYTIYCGMRGTTAILFVLAFSLITTNRFIKGKNKNSANTVILLMAFIAFIFKEQILELLINIAPSERIASRFSNILETIQDGYSERSFTGRGRLFELAFDSWLTNGSTFLFGIGELEINDNSLFKYSASGISGHSDVVDTLAKYGIIGFFLFARVIWLSYKQMKSLFVSSTLLNIIMYLFICLILYGTIKIMFHVDIFNVVFILLPLSLSIIEDYSNNQFMYN